MKIVGSLVSLVVLFAVASPGRAVKVKVAVTETEQVARTPAVITTGVPFARGAVQDVGKLAVSVGGKPVAAQFTRLAPWEDGSVRWALMDTQVDVPAGGKVELTVSDSGVNPAPAAPVKIEDGAEAVKVSTGPLRFVVNKKKFNLLESLMVDGKERITSAGRGLVVYTADGGEALAGPPAEVTIEQAGPLRAVVRVRGRFVGVHNGLLGYTVRLTALAGQKFIKAHVWLENLGAMGYRGGAIEAAVRSKTMAWFAFHGMAVELGLGLGESLTATCEGAQSAGSLKVLQVCKQSRSQEKAASTSRRPPFYTWNDFEYVITGAGKQLKKGDRTEGVVEIKGDSGTLTTAVRQFWENYDKAIELDGKTLKLWLWPVGGMWPRRGIHMDFGVTLDQDLVDAQKDGLYNLPGAIRKGHEFILDFSGRDPKEASAELSAPLFALASADYYAATEAAPGLFAPPEVRTADADCNAKLAAWVRMTRNAADPENPSSLFRARQQLDPLPGQPLYWHGWMDFGDIANPAWGPVNLHYDWPGIMLLGAMRTGETNFMRLAVEMTRHRIDVDQNWSDLDPAEVCGLQRPDSAEGANRAHFHCQRLTVWPSVAENWLAGTVLYYMLTGEPMALECCTRNAEGIKAAWDAIDKAKKLGGPRGNMEANAWSMSAYCAMYKLTGQKKWLDEAIGLFNRNVVPHWKESGPFLHDPNRLRDESEAGQRYFYSIASFCELQHLTGDANLFKLLKEACQQPVPDSDADAPLFLSDLYAYVGLKTKNEDLLKKAADLFAQSFPESPSPPVFLGANSTWTRTSAMTLRTGHLLQYAYWKMHPGK